MEAGNGSLRWKEFEVGRIGTTSWTIIVIALESSKKLAYSYDHIYHPVLVTLGC
jgi:hypothetical protein